MNPFLLRSYAAWDYSRAFVPEAPAMHELNFKWRNQRQIRKNRRRAFAAGDHRAFA